MKGFPSGGPNPGLIGSGGLVVVELVLILVELVETEVELVEVLVL